MAAALQAMAQGIGLLTSEKPAFQNLNQPMEKLAAVSERALAWA